jgi:hypothetical protein
VRSYKPPGSTISISGLSVWVYTGRMEWKPFARLCGVCGLSLAVLVGEEKEHLHVESNLSPAFFRVDNVVMQTSAPPITFRSR